MRPESEEIRKVAARGFTLLEVLVALLIFGIAFGAIAQTLQISLRQTVTAETLFEAAALAERQITLAGITTPLVEGEETGRSASGLRWRRSIEIEATPSEGDHVALYRVAVDVGSSDGDRSYVTVQTLRLGTLR